MDTDKKHPEEVGDFEDLHHEGEIPEFVKKYGGRILVFVAVFLVAVSALQLIKYNIGESQREKKERLASLVVEQNKMAVEAVNPDPEAKDSAPKKAYKSAELVANLEKLSKQAADSNVGKMATLQAAEAIRSDIIFADQFFSQEEKQAISQQANAIYETLLKKYPNDPAIVGPALIAQGLLAEELKEWDKAGQFYNQAIEKASGVLAGTVFVQQARDRLMGMDKRKETIEFVDAPEPEPVVEPEAGAVTVPTVENMMGAATKPEGAESEAAGPEIEIVPNSENPGETK